MSEENNPWPQGIANIDFDGSPAGVRWNGPTPEQKAEAEALRSDPRVIELMARHKRVSQRAPLEFAIVDHPLPQGIVAVVHLGQPGPLPRYAVVSATAFDDHVYLSARLNAFAYAMAHEDDNSPVTITIHSDKTVEVSSQRYGKSTQGKNERGAVADLHRNSGPMLSARLNAPVQDIPGHGPARVVHPGK
ncbi:MAG: hypothetical protein ABI229_00210 [Gemmatimonadaceae bacterium]